MINFLGFQITNKRPSEILDEIDFSVVSVIATLNPHSYVCQVEDSQFRKSLESATVLVADGEGVAIAASVFSSEKVRKISGYDLFECSAKLASQGRKRVLFFGSSRKTLDFICDRMAEDFPNCEVFSYSPPFKSEFDRADAQKFSEIINSISPHFLYLGLTAPKQEKLAMLLKPQLNPVCVLCVGAVFDFYARNIRRPPRFVIKARLEWAFRFLQEPRRLLRRNFVSTPIFVWYMLRAYFCPRV